MEFHVGHDSTYNSYILLETRTNILENWGFFDWQIGQERYAAVVSIRNMSDISRKSDSL